MAQQAASRLGALLLLVASAILGACATPPAIAPDPTATVPPRPAAASGYLAYTGGDGNVYVTAPGGQAIAITGDATAPPEGNGRSYPRVNWSRDGRLAYAAVERSLSATRGEVYIDEGQGGEPRLVGSSDDHFIIYLSWSPGGERLAYLVEEDLGIGLRVVEAAGEGASNRLVGLGFPHFFSWSPNGERILAHTGGARRHNPAANLVLYHLDTRLTTILPQRPGMFLAPAWSPDGSRWLGVTGDAGQDHLQVLGEGSPQNLGQAQGNFAVGLWSPDGSQVAFALRDQYDVPIFGPISVYDVASGESRRITGDGFHIQAFFWSPNGERLAYLTWLALPDENWMQWRTYDLEKNEDTGFAAFRPSWQMRYMISSFDQYAQSHRFWSPDGRYLVFADRDDRLVERVWLVDTWEREEREPVFVAEGTMGVFSWSVNPLFVCNSWRRC